MALAIEVGGVVVWMFRLLSICRGRVAFHVGFPIDLQVVPFEEGGLKFSEESFCVA